MGLAPNQVLQPDWPSGGVFVGMFFDEELCIMNLVRHSRPNRPRCAYITAQKAKASSYASPAHGENRRRGQAREVFASKPSFRNHHRSKIQNER
jgi:hypothetical protein